MICHGLQIDYNKNMGWEVVRIIEIILIILLIGDCLYLQIFEIKLSSIKLFSLFVFYDINLLAFLALKIYGPPQEDNASIQAVNVLRIIISILEISNLNQDFIMNIENFSNFKKLSDNPNLIEENNIILNNNNENIDNNDINCKILSEISINKKLSSSIIKSPKKDQLEFSDKKILGDINSLIKTRFKNSKIEDNSEQKFFLNLLIPANEINNHFNLFLEDSFDVFKFNHDCKKNGLYSCLYYFYKKYDIESLRIKENIYLNLIYNIQINYNDVPYHNSIHATDVTITSYNLMEKFEFAKMCKMTNLEKFILLLSCGTHDVAHPGNTNQFEINTKSNLALAYNDKSVLENYSLFIFFNFINNANMNIFSDLEIMDSKIIRKIFITNIIATDMSNHIGDLRKIKDIVNTDADLTKQENREFLMGQIVHLSDISNSFKPFKIYKKWVDLLFIEFYAQGDKEKDMNLPVSMLCDRNITKIPESQVFFISSIVEELLKNLQLIFPQFNNILDIIKENKEKWAELKSKIYILDESV